MLDKDLIICDGKDEGGVRLPVEEFHGWLRHARRGERLIYHIGLLMMDRKKKSVALTAKAAWAAHESRRVVLVQKRRNDGCAYIAIAI